MTSTKTLRPEQRRLPDHPDRCPCFGCYEHRAAGYVVLRADRERLAARHAANARRRRLVAQEQRAAKLLAGKKVAGRFRAADPYVCGTDRCYRRGCRTDECVAGDRERRRKRYAKRRPPLPPGDPRHGTRGGYEWHRCRCDECRACNAAASAEMWPKRKTRRNAQRKARRTKEAA